MAGRIEWILQQVRRLAHNLPSSAFSDDTLLDFVHEAQVALALTLPDAALGSLCRVYDITLSGYNYEFVVPSDFLRDRALLIQPAGATAPIFAQRWTVLRLGELYENPVREPAPERPYYTLWGRNVTIYAGSVTDIAARLFYVGLPAAPTLGADHETPPELDPAIIDYASSLLLQAHLDVPAAETAWEKFGRDVSTAALRYGNMPFEGILGDAGGVG